MASKSEIAKQIFDANPTWDRKQMLAQFEKPLDDGGANLSKAGASTYYANLKKAKAVVEDLVKSKTEDDASKVEAAPVVEKPKTKNEKVVEQAFAKADSRRRDAKGRYVKAEAAVN